MDTPFPTPMDISTPTPKSTQVEKMTMEMGLPSAALGKFHD
jgi:hypothetical protein